jgi:hypothetical protein
MTEPPSRPYKRFSQRNAKEPEAPFHPYQGIPPHLKSYVLEFVLITLGRDSLGHVLYNSVMAVDLAFHGDAKFPRDGSSFYQRLALDDVFLLDVLDWIARTRPPSVYMDGLNLKLRQGGSAYQVLHGGGIVGQSSPEAQESIERIVAEGKPGSVALARAWGRTYGREKDLRGALGDFVEAVETAAKPWVAPKGEMTLGTLIATLRTQSHAFHVGFGGKVPERRAKQLAGQLEMLWREQCNYRHGDPKTERSVPPFEVVHALAHVALGLVAIFGSGLVWHQSVKPLAAVKP